ncbi:uncharacterized protein [Chironomus tepperi]|uniref:uncharacterized protein n=1 Tax=Chironomus tepperi TaxID=113505 RepID=UPI00391F8E41
MNYKTSIELMNILIAKNECGNNFIHRIVNFNTAEVIEFTLQKIKENLNDSHFQEILRSKEHSGRNLLHIAAVYSKEVKTHQILWKVFRESCKSDEEFLEILREVDEQGSILFNLAAYFTDRHIIQFLIEELRNIATIEEVKSFLKHLGLSQQNMLQNAAKLNQDFELHKYLWEIIPKIFNNSEILEFINNYDEYGCHILHCAVVGNTKEIAEFTWSKIQNYISNKYEQIQYLTKLLNSKYNIHNLATESNDPEMIKWVEELLQKYEPIIILNHQEQSPDNQEIT